MPSSTAASPIGFSDDRRLQHLLRLGVLARRRRRPARAAPPRPDRRRAARRACAPRRSGRSAARARPRRGRAGACAARVGPAREPGEQGQAPRAARRRRPATAEQARVMEGLALSIRLRFTSPYRRWSGTRGRRARRATADQNSGRQVKNSTAANACRPAKPTHHDRRWRAGIGVGQPQEGREQHRRRTAHRQPAAAGQRRHQVQHQQRRRRQPEAAHDRHEADGHAAPAARMFRKSGTLRDGVLIDALLADRAPLARPGTTPTPMFCAAPRHLEPDPHERIAGEVVDLGRVEQHAEARRGRHDQPIGQARPAAGRPLQPAAAPQRRRATRSASGIDSRQPLGRVSPASRPQANAGQRSSRRR